MITDKLGIVYTLTRKPWDDGAIYYVLAGGEPVARARLRADKGCIAEVGVYPGFQRRGIASALYRAIELDLGRPLRPSRILSKAGRAFWTARTHYQVSQ